MGKSRDIEDQYERERRQYERLIRSRQERDDREQKTLAQQVNKVVKEKKIQMPITQDGFKVLCEGLGLQCTTQNAIEAILFCRGKNMDSSAPEEFDFAKMIGFLHQKQQHAAASENPRLALTGGRRNRNFQGSIQQPGRLPPLRSVNPMMHSTNRSMIKSQQSYDS